MNAYASKTIRSPTVGVGRVSVVFLPDGGGEHELVVVFVARVVELELVVLAVELELVAVEDLARRRVIVVVRCVLAIADR